MSDSSDYVLPKVWTWDKPSGGQFENINRPIAGPTHDRELPVGKHPYQLYSLATPNGQKASILFEELLDLFWRAAVLARADDDENGRPPGPVERDRRHKAEPAACEIVTQLMDEDQRPDHEQEGEHRHEQAWTRQFSIFPMT